MLLAVVPKGDEVDVELVAGAPKGVNGGGPDGAGVPNGLLAFEEKVVEPNGLDDGAAAFPNAVVVGGCHVDAGAAKAVVVAGGDPKPDEVVPNGFGGAGDPKADGLLLIPNPPPLPPPPPNGLLLGACCCVVFPKGDDPNAGGLFVGFMLLVVAPKGIGGAVEAGFGVPNVENPVFMDGAAPKGILFAGGGAPKPPVGAVDPNGPAGA